LLKSGDASISYSVLSNVAIVTNDPNSIGNQDIHIVWQMVHSHRSVCRVLNDNGRLVVKCGPDVVGLSTSTAHRLHSGGRSEKRDVKVQRDQDKQFAPETGAHFVAF
jgi:hypothetical protein